MVEPQCKIVTERYDRLVDIVPIIDNPTMNLEMSFKNEIDSFVDCCLNRGENISPVSDGVILMKILRAIYESADKGQEIDVK